MLNGWPGSGRLETTCTAHEAPRPESDGSIPGVGGAAEDVGRYAVGGEHGYRAVHTRRRDHEAEPDAHVEGPEHLLVSDVAQTLDESEDRWRLGPVFDVEPDRPRRAREVEQAVAGHVCHRAYGQARIEDGEHGPD